MDHPHIADLRECFIELWTYRPRHPPERMEAHWALSTWSDGEQWLVGLLYWGSRTVMTYRIDEFFDPPKVIADMEAKGKERFYFDAGGSQPAIWATRDELARAFRELGLIT